MKHIKDYSQEELMNLRQGQTIMTDMLRCLDRICRKHNLKYWCLGGTLIGAVRHKGWIPHDGDIDVGMLDGDFAKLQQVIRDELPKEYWFDDGSNHPQGLAMCETQNGTCPAGIKKIRSLKAHYTEYGGTNNRDRGMFLGITLDIFTHKLNRRTNKIEPITSTPTLKPMAYEVIFPVQELTFENIKVFVPKDLKVCLTTNFGEYPPQELPESKRTPHEGLISFERPDWMTDDYPFVHGSLFASYRKRDRAIRHKYSFRPPPKKTDTATAPRFFVVGSGATLKITIR